MTRLNKELSVVALALALCSAACPASPPRPTRNGNGNGSGSAAKLPSAIAKKKPAICRPAGVKLGIASAWRDGRGATVCLGAYDRKKMSKPLCARLAVGGGGGWTKSTPREPSASPARPSATLTKRALKVCPAGAAARATCKTFTTQLPARQTGAAVNQAGTRAAAVTFASQDNNGANVKLWTEVFDVKAGKLITRVATPAVGDNPCVDAKFLSDDYLALPSSNCAGPAGAMQVVDIAQGKRVVIERPAWGKSKARPLDTYDFDPLHVDRASYAFLGDYGASLVLYDLSIGKGTGALDLRPYFVAAKGMAPQLDPPETLKHAAYVAVGGDVVVFLGSPSQVLRGEQAVASVGQPGTAIVVDGRSGTVRETVRLPACSAR